MLRSMRSLTLPSAMGIAWATLAGCGDAFSSADSAGSTSSTSTSASSATSTTGATTSSSGVGGAGGVGTSAVATSGVGGAGGCDEPDCAPCPDAFTAGFSDDFENGDASPLWTPVKGSLIAIYETLGELRIQGVHGITNQNAMYRSVMPVDLTGCRAFVEVKATTGGDGSDTYFHLEAGTSSIVISQLGTKISFQVRILGATTKLATLEYVAAEHRWWRFREAAGTLFFDTSPDGLDWVEQANAQTPAFLTSAIVVIGSGTIDELAAPPPEVRFDNFNLPPP